MKIKDSVDLKELEKFGFEVGKFNCTKEKFAVYIFKNPLFKIAEMYVLPNRKIVLDILKEGFTIIELDVIYNLIRAGLVEE